ncbi:hypothetical protein HNR00_003080 [Methylorubrum rhodinum]|uniref:Uncharacterized protein n=1 Tax=Methylorubrum rhodinum TaxID=29428 RepID=A0A840ZM16_9HYPH|nr:hypothetical protein [Methylorubrum rhodinum]MBB5758360.1 hypothetical protein [Methylorubrum rhodinum]
MTDASADRAAWATAFADELLGFEHVDVDDVPEDAPRAPSPATRLTVSQAKARGRAQRARDKAKRAHELDAAIVQGLRSILRQRKVYERMRDGESLDKIAVRVEPILGVAMQALVEEHGWDRQHASAALNRKLLRPAQPPAPTRE